MKHYFSPISVVSCSSYLLLIADDTSQQISLDVAYDLRCQSDQLRVTKSTRVYGISHCPINENSVALIISDSRVLLWQLKTIDYEVTIGIACCVFEYIVL